jgi:hypothetical protein
MFRKFHLALSAAILSLGALAPTMHAQAAEGGVKAGVLSCHVDSGWGFVFGSSRTLNCTYSASPQRAEHYVGHISKYGVDIGYLQSGVIVWGVVAPTRDMAPGALAGDYGGVAGGASVGVGVDANVLFGGFKKSIALQPISFEDDKGLNVAAGIAAVSLQYEPMAHQRLSAK